MSRARGRRFKRFAALLLAVLLGAALSGCLEHPFHHSRREVIAYLDEKFPGEDITVSRKYTEEPDKDSVRTVRTWDCWFTFWNYYLDQYLHEVGSLDAWEIKNNELTLSFNSMAQVYPAQEQLQAFYDWLTAQPHAQDPLSAFTGIGIKKARYISCAGLYEMLTRLGFEPEGSPEGFSFTGADGALYEFSYENVLHRDGQRDWLYYLKDGNPVQSGSNGTPILYLGNEALETMTGLHFTFD